MSEWLTARDAVMYVVMALVFYWGLDRKNTERLIQAKFQAVAQDFAWRDQRFAALEQKVDDASGHSSREASRVTAKMGEISENLAVIRSSVKEAEERARHAAVARLEPMVEGLELGKVDVKLHEEQISDIRRRIENLEQRRRGDVR